MKRLFLSILLGLLSLTAGAQFQPSFNFPPRNVGTVSSAQQAHVPFIFARTVVPMVSVPTGTMANNGAITLGTALTIAYPNAYFFLPAGAVAAGVPASASWLFAQCSTTTACTVFNNTYTTGVPTIPTSPTAFSTTGPGAYTGDTSEQGVSLPISANVIGATGIQRVMVKWSYNNSAGTKTMRVRYSGASGTQILSNGQTTSTDYFATVFIANRATNVQYGWVGISSSSGASGVQSAAAAVDTTAASTLFVSETKGTATDFVVIEMITHELLSDGT